MTLDELYKLEHASLRSELDHTKNYQLTLLAYASAATGVILTVAFSVSFPAYFVPYVFVIVLMLGVTKLYMEKAKTICTIVAYFRVVLEPIMSSTQIPEKKYIGWENAMKAFRDLQDAPRFWRPCFSKEVVKHFDEHTENCNRAEAMSLWLKKAKHEFKEWRANFSHMPDLYTLLIAAVGVVIFSSFLLIYRALIDLNIMIGLDKVVIALVVSAVTSLLLYLFFWCESCHIVHGVYSYTGSEERWRSVLPCKPFNEDKTNVD